MKKSKTYSRVLFPAEVLKEAIDAYINEAVEGKTREGFKFTILEAGIGQESWTFDSVPEFIAEYAKRPTAVHLQHVTSASGFGFSFITTAAYPIEPNVTVTAPTREKIETVFNIFDLNEAKARIPAPAKVVKPPEPLRIFIGHGGSLQWRNLKDHLHDKHHLDVEAYEVGARAGHTIRDILEEMLGKSSFACLVLTGEDELKGGKLLARQNVIHEVGLFQGRLGFARAI